LAMAAEIMPRVAGQESERAEFTPSSLVCDWRYSQ
jgi:hypothetical protein